MPETRLSESDSASRLEAQLKDAVRMMHALKLPVALLFTGEFTE